jgi:HSP20 family molecular chaperone IbpA
MADVKVQKVDKAEDRTLPIFRQVDEMFGRVQRRAFELFAGRGFASGREFEDWIAAERELCWPATELSEQDRKYVLSVALPGYEPGQISVTATPRELIVQASARTERREEPDRRKEEARVVWSEFRSDEVYRRVEFPEPVDVSKVSANLANGMLKIVAEKAAKAVMRVPVSAAA